MLFFLRRLIGTINTSDPLQGITLQLLPQGIFILFWKIFADFKNLLVPKLQLGNREAEAPASRLEAGASRSAFPSWSLGTSTKSSISLCFIEATCYFYVL